MVNAEIRGSGKARRGSSLQDTSYNLCVSTCVCIQTCGHVWCIHLHFVWSCLTVQIWKPSKRAVQSAEPQPDAKLSVVALSILLDSTSKPRTGCCFQGQQLCRLQVHALFHCQLRFHFRTNCHLKKGKAFSWPTSLWARKKITLETALWDSIQEGAEHWAASRGCVSFKLCTDFEEACHFFGPWFVQLKLRSWTCLIQR